MRYLATMNFGDFMPPNARDSLAAAASRWGFQFIEITRPWAAHDPGDVFRHKLDICKFPAWKWDDEVTLIDGDILIRDDAPYPFSSTGTFAGVHGLADEKSTEVAVAYAESIGMPLDHARYFNGGLLRFYPHTHATVFASAQLLLTNKTTIGPMDEQTVMNVVAQQCDKSDLEVCMDRRFNTVGEAAWTERSMHESGQYVRHLARWNGKGVDAAERRAAIQAVKWRAE